MVHRREAPPVHRRPVPAARRDRQRRRGVGSGSFDGLCCYLGGLGVLLKRHYHRVAQTDALEAMFRNDQPTIVRPY